MNETFLSPVPVGRLASDLADDLPPLRLAFARAKTFPLRRDFPGGDPDAPPTGTVAAAWSGTSLHLLAELDDDLIHTRAVRRNDPLYQLGDTFEVFLQLETSPAYLELHVAPNNLTLQLLFPSPAEFARHRSLPIREFIARFALTASVLTHRIWLAPAEKRWTLLASVDLRLLDPNLTTLAGRGARFLYARYDYPAGDAAPVISCSARLRRFDFHAVEDWGTLRFE